MILLHDPCAQLLDKQPHDSERRFGHAAQVRALEPRRASAIHFAKTQRMVSLIEANVKTTNDNSQNNKC